MSLRNILILFIVILIAINGFLFFEYFQNKNSTSGPCPKVIVDNNLQNLQINTKEVQRFFDSVCSIATQDCTNSNYINSAFCKTKTIYLNFDNRIYGDYQSRRYEDKAPYVSSASVKDDNVKINIGIHKESLPANIKVSLNEFISGTVFDHIVFYLFDNLTEQEIVNLEDNLDKKGYPIYPTKNKFTFIDGL